MVNMLKLLSHTIQALQISILWLPVSDSTNRKRLPQAVATRRKRWILFEVERTLNVVGSGAQHSTLFKDLMCLSGLRMQGWVAANF
jgi:hypothetical protein